MSDFEKGMDFYKQLESAGQAHLLDFYKECNQDEKASFEMDLKSLEVSSLAEMFEGNISNIFTVIVTVIHIF